MSWKKKFGIVVAWSEIFVFTVFSPICVLSVWARLMFGKIHYQQIALNCGWENIPYVPRIYYLYAGLFFCAWLLLSVLYGLLICKGLPGKIRERLALSGRLVKWLKGLNFLFLGLLVEIAVWMVFFEFYFPLNPKNRVQFSDALEKQYVAADQMTFSFPEKKMNLIYVVSESLENAWSRPEFYDRNLMPEMTGLAAANQSFPGCFSVLGTWGTMVSLFSSQLALPYLQQKSFRLLEGKDRWPYSFYGNLSLFQILEKHGYGTAYLQGGSIYYCHKDEIYRRVPGISIESLETLEEDPEYREQKTKAKWGVNDRLLWKYARKKILAMNAAQKPFAVQILTLDTHFPSIYLEESEKRPFGDFRDAVVAQSRMIRDFVSWLEKQPFYENTLVVITGDHLAWYRAPSEKMIRKKMPGFQRTVYNCLIHSRLNQKEIPEIGANRRWAMYDLMPTILEAMGVTWQGHRLGVGTSLYAGEKTWLEKIGVETYNKEMEKVSRLYTRLK